MIRLRKANGEAQLLPPDVAAVEICSIDGKLARVIIPSHDGKVSSFGPDDEEFRAYARAVNAEIADIIIFTP